MPITRRQFIFIAAALIAAVVLVISGGISFLEQPPLALEERSLGGDLSFFALVNILIIGVMVVAFLVAKNLVRLFLDRKRGLFGSRLRTRLVIAFISLSMIPTVLLFFVAKGILDSVLKSWFSPQVQAAVDGARDVSKSYYDELELDVKRKTLLAADLLQNNVVLKGRENKQILIEQLEQICSRLAKEQRINECLLVDRRSQVLFRQLNPNNHSMQALPLPNLAGLRNIETNFAVVQPEETPFGSILRGYQKINLSIVEFIHEDSMRHGIDLDEGEFKRGEYYLVISIFLDRKIGAGLKKVVDAYDDYKQLKSYRGPIESSYLLTLSLVTLMVVFLAIWVGFFLARTVSEPIRSLAEGTVEVAHGNLKHRIPQVGDDEISILVRSFNKMTGDLEETTDALIKGRRYIETVLARLVVGVISIDQKQYVTTINEAASIMLGFKNPKDALGKELLSIIPQGFTPRYREIFEELNLAEDRSVTANVSLYINSRIRHFEVTATRLLSEKNESLGVVFLLSDLTELVRAQRMAAWREVARRIAHEIKNPLTPIQLSAERILRRFERSTAEELKQPENQGVLRECTTTIVNQVESLRALVNEFSQFARMPRAQLALTNLNQLVEETVQFFSEAHVEIKFKADLAIEMPEVLLDREQLRRVLINLMDNSVASIKVSAADGPNAVSVVGKQSEIVRASITKEEEEKQIIGNVSVETKFDENLGLISLSVGDDGLGIPDQDKPRLFEPYFSRKQGGTGLGLAIVSTIISDHQGFIRVKDNKPRGSIFVIELPAGDRDTVVLGRK